MAALKRRVANPLALAVLVLLYERAMHPYEMAATLRERRKEDSIKLRYGSLYTVIELLLKAGFIVQKKTMREGNRPERTVYELSKAGETEMRNWMREILSTPSKEYPQFEAGLSLLPALFSIESEYRLAGLETELGFVENLITRIRKDGCGFLKQWKLWHAEKAPRKKGK